MIADKTIVAVVGCQRSGTTLTGKILGVHSCAVLVDENEGLYDWFRAWAADSEQATALFDEMIARARLKYTGGQNKFEQRADGKWRLADHVTHVVLKAPNLTYAWAELAARPNPVKVVYPVRDPRAVVASMARLSGTPMVENQTRLIRKYGGLADEFASEIGLLEDPQTPQFVKQAIIWRIKSSLGSRFEAAGLSVFGFRYEDLVTDLEHCCRLMAQAVGLDFEFSLLAHEQGYNDIGPGLALPFRPVDRLSMRRWEDTLSPAQEAAIMSAAGELAARLGYVDGSAIHKPQRNAGISQSDLRAPIILAGRGGSGTRVLSELASGCGIFLGNRISESGDSVEWVDLIYEMVVAWLTRGGADPGLFAAEWQGPLLGRAREVLSGGAWETPRPWGWKLPETMIVAEPICAVFDQAKLVHFVRHPLTSAFRRTHLTSRVTNPVGKVVLGHAYRDAGRDPAEIESDPAYMHNALTWLYQVRSVMRFGRGTLGPERYLEIRFEDVCRDCGAEAQRLAAFCGCQAKGPWPELDASRAAMGPAELAEVERVWETCADTAEALGYSRTEIDIGCSG